jgi:hypothetical protein
MRTPQTGIAGGIKRIIWIAPLARHALPATVIIVSTATIPIMVTVVDIDAAWAYPQFKVLCGGRQMGKRRTAQRHAADHGKLDKPSHCTLSHCSVI